MSNAEDVKRRRQHELLRVRGVVGVGLGTKDGADCITVYVAADTAAVRAAIPAVLDGVATQIVVTGKFRAL